MSMTVNETTGEVKLTRGDSGSLSVNLELADQHGNPTGEIYELKEDDTLVFTLKKSAKETDIGVLIEKKINKSKVFTFSPSDTANLNFKRYYYDIQLRTKNGENYTVVGPAIFEITSEVGF